MIFHIACSGCGAEISVDERYFGKTGTCLKCGRKIVIEPPKGGAPNSDPPRPDAPPRRPPLAHVVVNSSKTLQSRKRDEDSDADMANPSQSKPTARPAREVQKRFARDIGIKFDDNITNRQLSALIASALVPVRESSAAEMVDQLEKRGLKTLMITWQKAEPDLKADLPKAVMELTSSEGMSPADIHFVLAAVVSHFLGEEGLSFPEYSRKYAEQQKQPVSHLNGRDFAPR